MINQFSYRLRSSTGKYYRVSGDTLELTAEFTELQNTPRGWQDKAVNWKRSWERMGIVRSFTIPLGFVIDEAEIIKALFVDQGYEADCIIEIHELNNSTRLYEPIFIGEVDFSTYDSDVNFTSCNFIEGGAQKLLTANEDTVYEIPIEDSDCIYVRMDGLNIFSKITYNGIDAATGSAAPQLTPLGYINTEGENIALAPAQQVFVEPAPNYTTSDAWLFRVLQTVDVRIKGVWRESSDTNGITGPLKVQVKTSAGRTLDIINQLINYSGRIYEIPFDVTLTLEKGEKVFIEHDPVNGSSFLHYGIKGNVTFEFSNRAEQLDMKCYTALTLFNKLCEKMGVSGQSDLLTSPPFFWSERDDRLSIAMTSLYGLVGQDGNVIKTSFKEFYKFIHCVYSASQYIDGSDKVRMEPIEHGFANTQIADIGEVSQLKVLSLKEVLFNKVNAGYQTQDMEEVNGKYIFNAEQQWSNSMKRTKDVLDMVAPYITDPYVIELTRIKQRGRDTTDDRTDNKVFAFHINVKDVINTENYRTVGLWREPTEVSLEPIPGDPPTYYPAEYSGVLDDTIFNFELSPRHNLLRNARYLASAMWNTDKVLIMESAKKNKELAMDSVLRDFVEKDPVNLIATPPLFIPVNIGFNALVDDNIFTVMRNNPRGYIKFSFLGEVFYGFIQEINIQPKIDSADSWMLLCAPQTDLKRLNELQSICEEPTFNNQFPNAIEDLPYEYETALHGTGNIAITNINNLPAGMNLQIIGKKLRLSGTPAAVALAAITFTLVSCWGNKSSYINLNVVPDVPISGLSVDEVLITTAKISWTANSYATEIRLFNSAGVLQSGYPVTVGIGVGDRTLSGLMDNTPYMVQLRSIVGGNFSAPATAGFSTGYGCYNYRYYIPKNVGSYGPSGPNTWVFNYEDCDGVSQAITVSKASHMDEAGGEFCARKITGSTAYLTRDGLCGGTPPACIPVSAGFINPPYINVGSGTTYIGEIQLNGSAPFTWHDQNIFVNNVIYDTAVAEIVGSKLRVTVTAIEPPGPEAWIRVQGAVKNCSGGSTKLIDETIAVYP